LTFLEVTFLEGRLLSAQSEQIKEFSKGSDRLKKTALQKSDLIVFEHENGLIVFQQTPKLVDDL